MAAFNAVTAPEIAVSRVVEMDTAATGRVVRGNGTTVKHRVLRPSWADRYRTLSAVEPEELGDEEERNFADVRDRVEPTRRPAVSEDDSGTASRVRSEVARDVLHRIDQVTPLVGDVSLATNIQLLKRELSRCHDVLKDYPSESSFLSLVTLVESAMSRKKWKDYTREQLELIRSAIEVGYRHARVSHDDYERVRQQFQSGRIDTIPRIDLESLQIDEFTDDQEN
jgi:hypothetical protein